MATVETSTTSVSIDAATQCGIVALSVAQLDRSVDFYTNALGFELLERGDSTVVLGAAGTPLLLLQERPGALPWMVDNMTGLYHFAILMPTRPDLGLWLGHYLTQPYPPPGQGDHIVSEALYLRDPDGHGIEVYRDRPREGWKWVEGRVTMGGGPVDVRGLLADAKASGRPWTSLPAGTKVGHIHLQVGDIDKAKGFYHGVLGFDVVATMPSALFVSAGGYHHHLGLNTWHSRGAAPAPEGTASLRFFSLALPTTQARDAVLSRLASAGIPYDRSADVVSVRDPWRNVVILHVGPLVDGKAAAELSNAI